MKTKKLVTLENVIKYTPCTSCGANEGERCVGALGIREYPHKTRSKEAVRRARIPA